MQSLRFVDATQLEALGRGGRPVLVAFVATWNPRCQAFAPSWRRLAEACATSYPALPVVAVDVDECTELNRRYEVCSVPTLLLLRDGQPVHRLQDTDLQPVQAWLAAAR
jgi:thioredoxin 2